MNKRQFLKSMAATAAGILVPGHVLSGQYEFHQRVSGLIASKEPDVISGIAPSVQILDSNGLDVVSSSIDGSIINTSGATAPVKVGKLFYNNNEDFNFRVTLKSLDDNSKWGNVAIFVREIDLNRVRGFWDWADYHGWTSVLERRWVPSYSYNNSSASNTLTGSTVFADVSRSGNTVTVSSSRMTASLTESDLSKAISIEVVLFRSKSISRPGEPSFKRIEVSHDVS